MGGGGKGGKAPRAPDYSSLIQQQANSDRSIAEYLTNANRINQYSPYGSSTFTKSYSDPTKAKQYQDYINYANAEIASGRQQAGGIAKWTAERDRQAKLLSDLETWSQTTSLTPEEQAIFNAEQGNRLSLQNMATGAIGRAGDVMSRDFNPQLMDFMTPQGLQQSRMNLPEYLRSNVNLPTNTLMGLQDVNEQTDQFKQQGDQVRDAIYKQMTQFSGERFGEQEAAERSRLASMGLQEGTQAYRNALQEFNRGKDESYQTSMLNAIIGGGQEQSRLVADQLAARASNIGLRQGQFGQNAQIYGMDQGERMNMFNTGSQRYAMDQSERQAQAMNQINLANLAAQQRQQQFGEQAYQRSLPINEIAALLGGGAVNMPTFNQYSQATPFSGPDYLGAAQAGYGAQMGGYNAGQNQKGSLLGAGSTILGGFLGGK